MSSDVVAPTSHPPAVGAPLSEHTTLGSTYDTEDSSPIMVSPSMAEDVVVLERHLESHSGPRHANTRPYIRLSNAKGESIVYRKVAKRREGLHQTATPGSVQLEIIENVLGPLKKHVLKLYATHKPYGDLY